MEQAVHFVRGIKLFEKKASAFLYPDLLKEWDYEKNGELDPFAITSGSRRKVWWKCENGHSWETHVYVRTAGHGCPQCKSGSMTSFAEQLFFIACQQIFPEYDVINRYVTSFGEEIDIYIPQLSLGLEPGNWVLHKKKYEKDMAKREKCKENGIRLVTIYDEYKESSKPFEDNYFTVEKFFGTGRNYLIIRDILKEILHEESVKENLWDDDIWQEFAYLAHRESSRPVSDTSRSLAEVAPDIAAEWHPTLNGELTPENVYAKSKQIAYWICPKGHEYQAPIYDRVSEGRECGICSKRTTDPRYNTISKLYPEFSEVFDESNEISPDEITPFSAKKVTWKCPHCKNTFVRSPYLFFRSKNTKCPHCGAHMPHTPNNEIDF